MNFDPALLPARLLAIQARADDFVLAATPTALVRVEHRLRAHFEPATAQRVAVAYQARYHYRPVAGTLVADASRAQEALSAMAQDLLDALNLVDLQWASWGLLSPVMDAVPAQLRPTGP